MIFFFYCTIMDISFGNDTNFKQKPQSSDRLRALIRQDWIVMSQDLAQKLKSSMPQRIVAIMKKKSQQLNLYRNLIYLPITVLKLINYNCSSIYHKNTWDKNLKKLKQQSLCVPETLGHDCTVLIKLSKLYKVGRMSSSTHECISSNIPVIRCNITHLPFFSIIGIFTLKALSTFCSTL